jgi:hypothetical protein
VTAVFYVTLQACAFGLKLEETVTDTFNETIGIVGGVHAGLCFLGFAAYFIYQLFSSQTLMRSS